jgi:DNA uptake protein ComE-like DNA-binding protein
MFRDFFYFSGAQRSGIVVLFVVLLCSFVALQLLPVLFPEPAVAINDPAFMNDVREFEASLQRLDTIKKWRSTYRPTPGYNYKDSHPSNHVVAAELFPFDPNTLDSAGLVQLGIPRHVVRNILRYRIKGGYYSSAQRFSETYGLSPDLFTRLQPYIVIETSLVTHIKIPDTEPALEIPVEINSADSGLLMTLKGVGRGIATSILRFRKASGGFVRVEQLRDVYGMNDELYTTLKPNITVDSTAVAKININSASVEKLRAHPYLNFYQAKAIYELRRKKGRLKSLQEIQKLEELDSETVRKIASYLSFE